MANKQLKSLRTLLDQRLKNCGSMRRGKTVEVRLESTKGWGSETGWKAVQRAAEGPDTLSSSAALLVIGCRAADSEGPKLLRPEIQKWVSLFKSLEPSVWFSGSRVLSLWVLRTGPRATKAEEAPDIFSSFSFWLIQHSIHDHILLLVMVCPCHFLCSRNDLLFLFTWLVFYDIERFWTIQAYCFAELPDCFLMTRFWVNDRNPDINDTCFF
jgi:hypothetical protein